MSGHASARATVTALLRDADPAQEHLTDRLLPLVYDELRVMAHRHLAQERRDHTLSTTALVHEAYLKLVDQSLVSARGQTYFFGAAARAMRQILVDHARHRGRQKRGGGQRLVSLKDPYGAIEAFAADVLDLDQALHRLAELNPRQAHVVECRFFGGLSIEETAEVLVVSPRTVRRDWRLAKAWLYRRLKSDTSDA